MSLQGDGLPALGNSDTGVMLGTSINIVTSKHYVACTALEKPNDRNDPQAMLENLLSYGFLQTFTRTWSWAITLLTKWVVQLLGPKNNPLQICSGEWLNQVKIQSVENCFPIEDTTGTISGILSGFIHGRNRDGSFTQLATEDRWEEDYAEGMPVNIYGWHPMIQSYYSKRWVEKKPV